MLTLTLRKIAGAGLALLAALGILAAGASAQTPPIDKWLDVFSPSTLTRDDQRRELEWFIKAAEL